MSFFSRATSTVFAASACLALGGAVSPGAAHPRETKAGPFVPLFDGESFAGWEGNQDFFRVEDGAVVAGSLSRKIPRNEFLCTIAEYGDFELRLQARTSREDGNGGIQLRSRRTPGSSEVVGYQADIGLQGAELPRNIWGALYDEARRRVFLAVPDQDGLARVFRPGEWNDYVVRTEGKHIRIWINGYQTIDYSETDPDIALSGIIGLQIHAGAPAEIRYRNIQIRPLERGFEESAEDVAESATQSP